MTILYLMIPISLLLAGFFVFGFIWSIGDGQMDDLETPRHRIFAVDDFDQTNHELNEKKGNS